jgi:TFIIF-interacting CTD phosphatase-like protein
LPSKRVSLPKSQQNINKKVLVIDLDETLFKSHEERSSSDDI